MNLRDAVAALRPENFRLGELFLRPIADDNDLWYATVECRLKPGQEDYVNPAGFSIGRAYLHPENHIPCVICHSSGRPIGYLVLRTWGGNRNANSWSYYLDAKEQGKGYGRAAAQLAVQVLKAADPAAGICLAVEADNCAAQRLYESLGFRRQEEKDGDDLIYAL